MTSDLGCLADTAAAAWYVIHTKPRNEIRALENLKNQGFECFLPTLTLEKRVRNRIQTVVQPMFSRYLFIRLNVATQNWNPIRSTLGVNALVSFGNQPAKVPESLIEALRQSPERVLQRMFAVGDKVEIIDGPLQGREGVYQMHDSEKRAMILVDLLGKPQRLRIALDALTKIDA